MVVSLQNFIIGKNLSFYIKHTQFLPFKLFFLLYVNDKALIASLPPKVQLPERVKTYRCWGKSVIAPLHGKGVNEPLHGKWASPQTHLCRSKGVNPFKSAFYPDYISNNKTNFVIKCNSTNCTFFLSCILPLLRVYITVFAKVMSIGIGNTYYYVYNKLMYYKYIHVYIHNIYIYNIYR